MYNSSNTAVIANNLFGDNSRQISTGGGSNTAYNVDIRYNSFDSYRSNNLPMGPGNLDTFSHNDFVDPYNDDYHVIPTAPSIDAADPDAAVPEGGGSRADAGAFEYQGVETVPATLLLGHENASTAIANSGVNGVEIGIVPVADPSQPITATEPATWSPVTLDSPGSTVSEWQNTTTPATDGLYRFYSRATDEAANQEADQWYDGAFIADGTPPVVTWLSPANGSTNVAPLELRAQVSDYALDSLSVADFYFVVDGTRQDAAWSGDAWDEEAHQPRIFRAWVDLANGAHTVTAVAADHAGNTTETAAVTFTVSGQNPADITSPTLTITSPLPNLHYQKTITFTGQAFDDLAGSGMDVVQVSLDGGWTWQTAALNGSDWEFILENDDASLAAINYLIAIRALDKAGNETRPANFIVSIDNRPPSGLLPVIFDIPLESHLDTRLDSAPLPLTVNIDWEYPWDFSGVNGSEAITLLAVDQISSTIPISPTNFWPFGNPSEFDAPFIDNGDWYIHLAARDAVDNQIVYHFGPWHVGTVATTVALTGRVQSIIVDGFMDFDNDEWRLDWEYLDDGEDGDGRQELYFTLDNSNIYLGWSNSWWEIDGTMWAYLDTAPGGSAQPVTPTDPALPFNADYAVEVYGATSGRVWQFNGMAWVETTAISLELIQGDNGDTELRFGLNPSTLTNLQLLAYAAADNGDIWRVFPTSNHLNGPWNDAYQWNPQTTVDFNEGQPVGVSVNMQMDSPQAPDAFHGPSETLDLVFTLDNLEQREISGLQLDVNTTTGFSFTGVISGTCSTCTANHYVVDVPAIPPTLTHTITVTGQLAADLSAVTAVTHTVAFNSSPTQSAILSHLTDGNPPQVTARITPGMVTAGGGVTTTQTVYGTATDHAGSGVALVEVRFNGSAWQPAAGTTAWQTTVNVASGNILLEARATDAVGLTSPVTSTTYIVDVTPPTLSMTLPLTLTGLYAEFSGVSSDGPSGNEVARVEVQLDDDANPWLTADLYAPDGNAQEWQFTWNMPYEDLQPHTIRARAVDWAGNVSAPLAWQPVNVDTVLPNLLATQVRLDVPAENYVPVTVLQGTVTDGSGVAGVDVWIYDPTGHAYTQTAVLPPDNTWYFRPDFTNPPEGRYGLWAQATDHSGNQKVLGPYCLKVIGPPQPPTLENVNITTPIIEGSTAVLSGGITDPNMFDTFTMTVKWGDGITTTFYYPEGTDTFTESHVYADDDPSGTPTDTYTVSLALEDSGGYSDDETVNITVQNVPPTVTASADQTTVKTGVDISFTGIFTDAGTADTHTILWEFGDGSTAAALAPTHAFASAGVYTATLTITDDDGGIGRDQVGITVQNTLPTVTASANPITVSVGTAVSFTGIFTDTDQADTHTVLWEFGDGATADTLTTTHAYTNAGVYTATLTVTDNHGGAGRDQVLITVESYTIYLPLVTNADSAQMASGLPLEKRR